MASLVISLSEQFVVVLYHSCSLFVECPALEDDTQPIYDIVSLFQSRFLFEEYLHAKLFHGSLQVIRKNV